MTTIPKFITPGAIFSTANTWPEKWTKYFFRVSDDGTTAIPLVGAKFWCSTPGPVVSIAHEAPRPLTFGQNKHVGDRTFAFESSNQIRLEKSAPEVTK